MDIFANVWVKSKTNFVLNSFPLREGVKNMFFNGQADFKGNLTSTFNRWIFLTPSLREPFKYYFADFVRKGGGGTPQIRNPLFAEKKIRKGGRGVPPKSVTYFLDQNQVFFEQKTPFLALFEEKISGKNP